MVSLCTIADIVRGVTFSKADGSSSPSLDRLPVIRAGSIQNELLVDVGQIWVPAKKLKKAQLIRRDDIVMCTSSGSSDLVGKCAKANADWHGSFGAFCAGIRTHQDRCDPSYLYHFLCSPRFRNWTKSSSGANIKNIRVSELAEFQVPLPPLEEQKRIAAILDKADAIRRKRQQAIELADQFLRSVFLDMFGDPVTNPKGWKKHALKDLVQSPITYGILKPEEFVENGIPMLRIQDIKRGELKTTSLHRVSRRLSEQYSRTILSGGELVISLVGTLGLTAIVPSELKGANLHRNLGLIDIQDSATVEYMDTLFKQPEFMHLIELNTKGGIQKLLNLGDLKEILFPVPDQQKIEEFREVKRKCKEGFSTQTAFQNQSATLFNALVKSAFKGELTSTKVA